MKNKITIGPNNVFGHIIWAIDMVEVDMGDVGSE